MGERARDSAEERDRGKCRKPECVKAIGEVSPFSGIFMDNETP